jgi:SAM-dependent methyltransferase
MACGACYPAFRGTSELFGGEWQKIGLARTHWRSSTCAADSVLIVDEPTSALDPEIDFCQMDFTIEDITALPHPSYSLMTCRLVFRWMPDKTAFLDSVCRLLAPGGIFWVATSLHHPEEGPARAWQLAPTDSELLTANWSSIRRSSSSNYSCFALRP